MAFNKKNGTKVDVREVHHRAWGVVKIQRATDALRAQAAELYGKLLDTVPADLREQAVRCRIFEDNPEAAAFSTDHPRLFSLVTSERFSKSPELQKQLTNMLATKRALEQTGGNSKDAHKKFVQSVMTANTKTTSAPPVPPSDAGLVSPS